MRIVPQTSIAKILDGRLYMIRFSSLSISHGKPIYANTSETSFTLEKLRPYTQYEFAVKVMKDRRESEWSMTAVNTTFIAGKSATHLCGLTIKFNL